MFLEILIIITLNNLFLVKNINNEPPNKNEMDLSLGNEIVFLRR